MRTIAAPRLFSCCDPLLPLCRQMVAVLPAIQRLLGCGASRLHGLSSNRRRGGGGDGFCLTPLRLSCKDSQQLCRSRTCLDGRPGLPRLGKRALPQPRGGRGKVALYRQPWVLLVLQSRRLLCSACVDAELVSKVARNGALREALG